MSMEIHPGHAFLVALAAMGAYEVSFAKMGK